LLLTTKTLKTSTATVVLQRTNTRHLVYYCYWAWATQPVYISYDRVHHIVPHTHKNMATLIGTTYMTSDGYYTYHW